MKRRESRAGEPLAGYGIMDVTRTLAESATTNKKNTGVFGLKPMGSNSKVSGITAKKGNFRNMQETLSKFKVNKTMEGVGKGIKREKKTLGWK
jgi:hypothetical protein